MNPKCVFVSVPYIFYAGFLFPCALGNILWYFVREKTKWRICLIIFVLPGRVYDTTSRVDPIIPKLEGRTLNISFYVRWNWALKMNSPSSHLAVGQVAQVSSLELFPVPERGIHSAYHTLQMLIIMIKMVLWQEKLFLNHPITL